MSHRKIGGIHFFRLWKFRLSFCVARNARCVSHKG